MSDDFSQLLTIPEYAKRIGVAKYTIQNAIKTGMLKESVIIGKNNKKFINPEIAESEYLPRLENIDAPRSEQNDQWELVESPEQLANIIQNKFKNEKTNEKKLKEESEKRQEKLAEIQDKKDDADGILPLKSSRRRALHFEAELARIKFEKENGKLVDASEVEIKWNNMATLIKTKIVGVPSRYKQRVPEITEIQYEILNDIVKMALEELANDNIDESIE